ncbi:MAG: hypothetical protein Q9172_001525 [Xanthocarpia lactea]
MAEEPPFMALADALREFVNSGTPYLNLFNEYLYPDAEVVRPRRPYRPAQSSPESRVSDQVVPGATPERITANEMEPNGHSNQDRDMDTSIPSQPGDGSQCQGKRNDTKESTPNRFFTPRPSTYNTLEPPSNISDLTVQELDNRIGEQLDTSPNPVGSGQENQGNGLEQIMDDTAQEHSSSDEEMVSGSPTIGDGASPPHLGRSSGQKKALYLTGSNPKNSPAVSSAKRPTQTHRKWTEEEKQWVIHYMKEELAQGNRTNLKWDNISRNLARHEFQRRPHTIYYWWSYHGRAETGIDERQTREQQRLGLAARLLKCAKEEQTKGNKDCVEVQGSTREEDVPKAKRRRLDPTDPDDGNEDLAQTEETVPKTCRLILLGPKKPKDSKRKRDT